MQLTLSSQSVRNTIFTHESGQVMYRTTHQWGTKTATLHKVKPNEDPMDMHDKFEVIGEIKWQLIGSSTLRLNGQDMLCSDFIPSHGVLRRRRTFTGPDGCPYRWDMLVDKLVLSRDDSSRAEVARYRRRTLGVIGPKRKPVLEVSPDVEHMLDLVVLTFVFVEKIRMDKDGKK